MPNQLNLEASRSGPFALVGSASRLLLLIGFCSWWIGCGANGFNSSISTSTPNSSSSLKLSASSIDFGNYSIGSSAAPKKISVKNSGTEALSIASIKISGSNSKDFTQSNSCGTTLAAAASCSVSVTFKPSAAGTRTGSLLINDAASSDTATVALRGTASSTTLTSISFSPASVNFGSAAVGSTTSAQSVTVKNSGSQSLSISSVYFNGANPGEFAQTNNCGGSIATGATCVVKLTFKPAASGTHTAALNFADNASGSPQQVGLQGTGSTSSSGTSSTTTAPVGLSPLSLGFTSRAIGTASPAQTVTFSNSGKVAVSISSVSISGTNFNNFSQTNTCGSSVNASSSCIISVVFNPSANGLRTASLSITDSAIGSPHTVALSGAVQGTAGAISISPASLNFSIQPITISSVAQVVTVTNTGTSTLAISGFSIKGNNAGDFVQTNNCSSSLAAGSHCNVVVLFIPLAAGTRSAALSITDSAVGSPHAVSLAGGGSHDVVLTWTPSSSINVVGYNVFRGSSSGGEGSTPINSVPIAATNYTDVNVVSGQKYFYLVTTVTGDGSAESGASAETSATIP